MLLIGYKFYRKLPIEVFWEFHFCLYPLEVILFCIEFVVYIPIVRNFLIFMGRNSAYIYIVHAFILLYLRDFIYKMPHFMISYVILLGISIIVSIMIRWLEQVIDYEKLINKIYKSIEVL